MSEERFTRKDSTYYEKAMCKLQEYENKKESGLLLELPCIAYNVKECRYQIISTKNGRIYASKLYRDRKEAEIKLKELKEGKNET